MRKALFQIGLPLILLGAIRLIDPSLLFRFAGLDFSFGIMAIFIAGAVLLLTGPLGDKLDFRPLFAAASIACLVLLVICLNTPTLWGLRATYVSILDIFVAIESSLLLALGALQPKAEAISIFTLVAVWGQLLIQKLRRTGPAFGHGLHVPHYN